MLTSERKKQILEAAGYAFSFDRLSYINRDTHKVFSIEFVQDNTEERLKECISEETASNDWSFYFNSPPSESVKREFSAIVGR